MFEPSKYQQAVYQAVERGTPAIVVSAVAGSGKSTTLVNLLEHIPSHKSVMYLTFGKDANIHLNTKIDQHVLELLKSNNTEFPQAACKTVHSVGNGALMSIGIKGDATKGSQKYLKIIRAMVDAERMRILNELNGLNKWDEEQVAAVMQSADKYTYQLAQNMRKLIDMVRLTLIDPVAPELRAIIKRFEIDIIPEDEDVWPFVLKSIPAILQLGIDKARTENLIDFTDQIWLPSSKALNLQPKQYDVVLVDEAQDLSPCQRELALRCCKPNGQKIFVGDRNQSIFGFAGASLRSIDEIIEATSAIELPLSICYRCPRSVIEEARNVGPDYQSIEASEWAPSGEITYATPDEVSSRVRPGDLILCRLTAPLVSKCLELLRDGKRANVRGRDLGAQFTAMIEQIQKFASNLNEIELFLKLNEITRKFESKQIEIMSLNLDENEMKIATLQDKTDTLLALYEAYVDKSGDTRSLKGFQSYITEFFKEDPNAQIILSTGHRAKGLEFPRVFILGYDELPHPRAKTKEAIKQENNLQYVMVTRCLYDSQIEGSGTLFLVVKHVPEPEEEQPTLFDVMTEEAEEEVLVNPQSEYTSVGSVAQLAPVLEAQAMAEKPAQGNTRGDIKVGDYVIITYLPLPEMEYCGTVKRIDTNASGEDCYLVQVDDLLDYFCGNTYQIRFGEKPAEKIRKVTQEAPRTNKPGPKGETKKKDFRFPVRLLEALKAAADEDGMSDTEFLMSVLKSDKRIQKKLFEDKHEQADFYVEEEGATK